MEPTKKEVEQLLAALEEGYESGAVVQQVEEGAKWLKEVLMRVVEAEAGSPTGEATAEQMAMITTNSKMLAAFGEHGVEMIRKMILADPDALSEGAELIKKTVLANPEALSALGDHGVELMKKVALELHKQRFLASRLAEELKQNVEALDKVLDEPRAFENDHLAKVDSLLDELN